MRIHLALCALTALTAQDLTQKANASSLPVPVPQTEDADVLNSSPSHADTVVAIAPPESLTITQTEFTPISANSEASKSLEISAPEFSPSSKFSSNSVLEPVVQSKAPVRNTDATSNEPVSQVEQEQLAEKTAITPLVEISDNAPEAIKTTAASIPSVAPVAPRVTFDNVIEIEKSQLPREIQDHISIGSTLVGSNLGLTKNTPITDQGLPLIQWADQVRQCSKEKPQLFIVREETKNEKGVPVLRVAPILFDGQPGRIVRNANGQLVCPSQNAATTESTPSSEQSSNPTTRSSNPQDISEMYDRATKAVVFIRNNASINNEGKIDVGSGFMVRQRNGQVVVVTNAHVVENLAQGEKLDVPFSKGSRPAIEIVLHDNTADPNDDDGTALGVEVIGFDAEGADLAALRVIQPLPNLKPLPNLPTLNLAPVNSIKIGDPAYVIGTPLGDFQNAMTNGIVSLVDQKQGHIVTNAEISGGNSGGPLLNSRGEVIGVVTARNLQVSTSDSGLTFAISIDRVRTFLEAVQQEQTSPVTQRFRSREGGEPLPLNEARAGRLDQDSLLAKDNSYYKVYVLDYPENSKERIEITVKMSSNEVEPYLLLFEPDGKKLAEAPSKDGVATIKFTPSVKGRYRIIANTRKGGQKGVYRIDAQVTRQE